jgi:hypothetical protein
MDNVDRLLALEAIKQLKARYFRCMDTKDWNGLGVVFTEDATADSTEGLSVKDPVSGKFDRPPSSDLIVGSVNILAYLRKAVENLVTVHHGHMPEIRIISDTTAQGTWAFEDILQKREGKVLTTFFHGFGHYHDTYEFAEGEWRVKFQKITRLSVDTSL